MDEANAGWLALQAAEQAVGEDDAESRSLLEQAHALDPLLPEVACEGAPWWGPAAQTVDPRELPTNAARRALCEHTRSLPVRGAE